MPVSFNLCTTELLWVVETSDDLCICNSSHDDAMCKCKRLVTSDA